MSQQLSREEQERKYPEYTWDLTTIFKDDEAFEAAFKEVENELAKKNNLKDTLVIVLRHYTMR